MSYTCAELPVKNLATRGAELNEPREALQAWLNVQCRILASVRHAVIVLWQPGQADDTPPVSWPANAQPDPLLIDQATRAMHKRTAVTEQSEDSSWTLSWRYSELEPTGTGLIQYDSREVARALTLIDGWIPPHGTAAGWRIDAWKEIE